MTYGLMVFISNHDYNLLIRALIRINYQLNKKIIVEQGRFLFHDFKLSPTHHYYFDGYWQNLNYFTEIETELRKDFELTLIHERKVEALKRKIQQEESVCIQVRRDDFITFKEDMGIEYFKKAVQIFISKLSNPKFYVFPDDPAWAYENLTFDQRIEIVPTEYNGVVYGSMFYLMQNCKHFIIPNSTFGWWAAWLGKNPHKIVITPKIWIKKNPSIDTSGLIPTNWIRI